MISAPILIVALVLAVLAVRLRRRNTTRRADLIRRLGVPEPHKAKLVGYFHPFCNAGGGGERVLWTAISRLQRREPHIINVVYTGDVDATPEEIIQKAKSRFDIDLSPSSLHFVFLKSRSWVEDSTWPRFTLAGQAIGSMYLAWEAMHSLIPDLFIDTMGYAFTFHVVSWLAGIPIGAYVHYPTISTEMVSRVKSRTRWHTNSDTITSSSVLSTGKLMYYRLFMYYYKLSLRTANFTMVNSSWTKNHVDFILRYTDPLIEALHYLPPFVLVRLLVRQKPLRDVNIVYPPCDTRAMAGFALSGRERVVLSIAQFRPEKNHSMQLSVFSELINAHPEHGPDAQHPVRLVVIGGSRTPADDERVRELREMSKALGIDAQVEFIVNASYAVILEWLSRASVGLSTMVDEHFGINIVEFMAAGVIPVTHASGGPLNDIVVPYEGEPTGYHARSVQEFVAAVHAVLTLSPAEDVKMRQRARKWAVHRFSEDGFERGWNASGWRECL